MREAWVATFAALILGSLLGWTVALVRLAGGRPLVPYSPRRPVPWAFFDLLALVAITLVTGAVVQLASGLSGRDDSAALTLGEQRLQTAGVIVASLLSIAVGLPLVWLRTGATPADFGWDCGQATNDLRRGIIGFVLLAPPVLGLQALLVLFWKPSKHPLIEGLKETPDLGLYTLAFAAAVVVAPLVEELLFRVILQGFLEKAFSFRGEAHELFFGTSRRRSVTEIDEGAARDAASLATQEPSAREGINPYASPADTLVPDSRAADASAAPDDQQTELRGPAAWLPIAISSIIFALMHYSHGPDWVPLTVLAAGMGYLYQRTHRLLPSLTVHALLNAFSMWGLWIEIYAPAT
jgi:membrane protease YdiL (CAAX protease family)